jgi:uncharacterized protein (TIGR02271 family)
MYGSETVREGMTVFSADGEKVGKIGECGSREFTIEKGLLFKQNYLARYEDIADVRGGDVYMTFDRAALLRAQPTEAGALGEAREAGRVERPLGTEERRIPLTEEQIEIERRTRPTGEVRVKKDVKTEEKEFTVPVTREEAVVERRPVEGAPAAPEAGAFREGEVSIPIHEEEVEVHKRPVVKEEVRVRKEAYPEERAASATVRREDVEVEEEGRPGRHSSYDEGELKKT